ncbi:uncharacterized protein EV422DRAFT_614646, partial [Fimicolochytrium jonesii]|uniref:uncharacterized protein n=1 Tax=Fimicolochytrium jonesii TaxID=1396493 RepID=UPI0022FEB9A4
DVEPPADAADEEYLDYEEEHGYSTLSPEEILQSVFMDLPVEEIRDSLIANGWNVERTLETLLTPEVPHIQLDANYDRPTQTSTAISTQNVRPVCRHFLGGNCYRSDCWYSHDPEGLVCRYWLSGGCMKGTACPFTHGSDLLGRTTETAQRSHPSIPQPARPPAEDFPALSASKGPARAKLDFWGPTQKFVDVARKKPAKGSLPPSVSNTNAPSALVPLKRSTTLVQAKWVSTGDTLAATYTQFRQEAIDAAIQRNKLFQRATQAYLSGNKAAAKAFSLGAHRMNERVEELHRQAGKRIYATRNASHTVNGNGDVQVDLHGLHPSEAVEMLESKIANLKRQNFSGRLIVVTGTGNHSRGQKAKLLPAIREYLQQKGLRAQESSMSDRRGGAFTINI